MDWENALHAHTEGDLANAERCADAAIRTANHSSLEDLDTLFFAFTNTIVDLDGVTNAEWRKRAELRALNGFDLWNLATHGTTSSRKGRFSYHVILAASTSWVHVLRMLKPGDLAPAFNVTDQNGAHLDLDTLVREGPVVVYFYPKDFTAVCTKEACYFRDAFEEFSTLNARVIGVSVDDDKSHKSFADEHKLPFSLVSDADRRLAKAFDIMFLGFYAKRVTFVIDGERRIRAVIHAEIMAAQHVNDVRAALAAIK